MKSPDSKNSGLYFVISKIKPQLPLAALIFSSLLIFLFNLGQPFFIDYDEASYATVLRDTAQTHPPIFLIKQGEPWIDKPPLYFWLGLAVNKIIASPELAFRLPSALLGLASIALTFLLTLELASAPR